MTHGITRRTTMKSAVGGAAVLGSGWRLPWPIPRARPHADVIPPMNRALVREARRRLGARGPAHRQRRARRHGLRHPRLRAAPVQREDAVDRRPRLPRRLRLRQLDASPRPGALAAVQRQSSTREGSLGPDAVAAEARPAQARLRRPPDLRRPAHRHARARRRPRATYRRALDLAHGPRDRHVHPPTGAPRTREFFACHPGGVSSGA